MVDSENLTDEQLEATADVWRRRALHGDRAARGIAHKLEQELRRRKGVLTLIGDLDTRPYELRHRRRPWWRIW
jgi:hypothetical protein